MNYFLLIASPSEDVDGIKISSLEMAERRLSAKSWGLWVNTPHKKEINQGDLLLVYIAGEKGKQFIATASARDVVFGVRTYESDGNALTDPPCAVLRLDKVQRFAEPLPIAELRHRLDFIPKNVVRWGCVLQRGVKRISFKDATTILKAAGGIKT